MPLQLFEWGQCTLCPGDGCSDHGKCTKSGSCSCDLGFAGDGCENLDTIFFLVMGLLGLVLLMLMLCGFCVYRRVQKGKKMVLRSVVTMNPVAIKERAPGILFDLFLPQSMRHQEALPSI